MKKGRLLETRVFGEVLDIVEVDESYVLDLRWIPKH